MQRLHQLRHLGFVLVLVVSTALAQTPQPVPPAANTSAPAPAGNRLEPPPGGMPVVHDPSTVIEYRGRYYVYTTGRGMPILSSPDLVHWARLGSVFTQIPERVHDAVPKNNGTDVWAPDIIRVGDKFYLYYAVSSWGLFLSVVALATNTTLDPADPAYHWVDQGVVVGSDGIEDMNDIDPGVVRAPDGTMWLCYGSYHGSIKILQIDPNTGLALAGDKAGATAVAIARQSEGADIITHDGFFYLFVNHGTCCQGKKSEYNIRVGRSRTATGPYLDKHGVDLRDGGGSLFLAAHDHRIGPGHFGRVIPEPDPRLRGIGPGTNGPAIEQFSLHYEADLNNAGRPTLGIRPLLWSPDGWPVAGDTLAAGTFQILSAATEDSLQSRAPSALGADARATPHLGRYLAVAEQQWTIEPAGDGFSKIANAGTKAMLGAGFGDTVALTSANDNSDADLWHLDQFTDGSYRLRNKAANKCLGRQSDGMIALTICFADDDHRWLIASP